MDQYTDLIGLDGVSLSFTKEAIKSIAHRAYTEGTGARGLRSVLEEEMLDLMFELPDETDVTEVVVSADESDHLVICKNRKVA